MDASTPPGLLYVVATPIGNPEDLSPRAVKVLREVELIACEDTRRTARLLAVHQIATPTVSYFEHNEPRRLPELMRRLAAGARIAMVSDAGTPTISDPGYRLVRAALAAGIRVTTVPGPSALIAALTIAGLPTDRFVFEGFLPTRAGERAHALERLRRETRTIVLYESPRRLTETLHTMIEVFGAAREAAVMRELTKTHEESVRGSLREIASHFIAREPLGEVTIVIAGATEESSREPQCTPDAAGAVKLLREAGLSLRDASAVIAKLTGVRKRAIYRSALDRSRR